MSKKPRFSLDLAQALAGDAMRRAKHLVAPRKVVTLHHLACSGGTIITKTLSAMRDAMVVSEIHPDRAAQPAFHPHNQLRNGYEEQLSRIHRGAMRGHFQREMIIAYGIAKSLGKTLIIRDHSHVDFVWRGGHRSMLSDQLQSNFEIRPIVTIRDPREVWLSVKREGWFDGTPDELCRAHCRLFDAFPRANLFKYEDFTREPDRIVAEMCTVAGVTFEADYASRLDDVKHLTGDSGRKSGTIAPRPPKPLADEDRAAFDASPAFAELKERMGYEDV